MALCWTLCDSFQRCLESRCNNMVWPPDGVFETVGPVWEDNFASVCRCLCSPSWTQLGDRVSPVIFCWVFLLADPGSTERKLQLKRKVLISPFCLLSQHGRRGSATKRQTDPNKSGKISLFFSQAVESHLKTNCWNVDQWIFFFLAVFIPENQSLFSLVGKPLQRRTPPTVRTPPGYSPHHSTTQSEHVHV